MPILFIIFIALSVRSATLDGADKGLDFLLTLDMKHLGFTDEGFKFMPLFETFTAYRLVK